jgi:hypothetical protein
MDLNALIPLKGIGPITFGLKKSDIISVMGDNYIEEWDEEDLSLIYEDEGLEFTFWGDEDDRLGLIDSTRETLTMCGQKLFGASKEKVRKFIKDELGGAPEISDCIEEEDGMVEEWIEISNSGVTFWFSNGLLSSLIISCDWVEEEEPVWPAESPELASYRAKAKSV